MPSLEFSYRQLLLFSRMLCLSTPFMRGKLYDFINNKKLNLFRQKFLAISTHYTKGKGNNAMNQSAAQMRVEQRVTLTVCVIVSCFIITQVGFFLLTFSIIQFRHLRLLFILLLPI